MQRVPITARVSRAVWCCSFSFKIFPPIFLQGHLLFAVFAQFFYMGRNNKDAVLFGAVKVLDAVDRTVAVPLGGVEFNAVHDLPAKNRTKNRTKNRARASEVSAVDSLLYRCGLRFPARALADVI